MSRHPQPPDWLRGRADREVKDAQAVMLASFTCGPRCPRMSLRPLALPALRGPAERWSVRTCGLVSTGGGSAGNAWRPPSPTKASSAAARKNAQASRLPCGASSRARAGICSWSQMSTAGHAPSARRVGRGARPSPGICCCLAVDASAGRLLGSRRWSNFAKGSCLIAGTGAADVSMRSKRCIVGPPIYGWALRSRSAAVLRCVWPMRSARTPNARRFALGARQPKPRRAGRHSSRGCASVRLRHARKQPSQASTVTN